MIDDPQAFPVHITEGNFLGPAGGQIPFADGLVPLDEAQPGDIVSLNFRYLGAAPKATVPTYEPEDWGVGLTLRSKNGYDPNSSFDLISVDALRKCAPALIQFVAHDVIADCVWNAMQAMTAEDTDRRSLVLTLTASNAALVTASENIIQDAFESGLLDDPKRISDFVRVFTTPYASSHAKIARQPLLGLFLDYVAQAYLPEHPLGGQMLLKATE